MKWVQYLLTLIEGPGGTISSARVLALVFGVVGCMVALTDGAHWETVSCLVGGGSVSLLLRQRGEPPKPGSPDA